MQQQVILVHPDSIYLYYQPYRWSSGYGGGALIFINSTTLCYAQGNVLTLVDQAGCHVLSLTSQGKGVGQIASCPSAGLFAYSEVTLKPKIFILKYPECDVCGVLEGRWCSEPCSSCSSVTHTQAYATHTHIYTSSMLVEVTDLSTPHLLLSHLHQKRPSWSTHVWCSLLMACGWPVCPAALTSYSQCGTSGGGAGGVVKAWPSYTLDALHISSEQVCICCWLQALPPSLVRSVSECAALCSEAVGGGASYQLSFNPLNWRQLCLVSAETVTLWTLEQCGSQTLLSPQ